MLRQQRNPHGEASTVCRTLDYLDRPQRNLPRRRTAGREVNAEQIEHARPTLRCGLVSSACSDNGSDGVGGILKAVDESKAERISNANE